MGTPFSPLGLPWGGQSSSSRAGLETYCCCGDRTSGEWGLLCRTLFLSSTLCLWPLLTQPLGAPPASWGCPGTGTLGVTYCSDLAFVLGRDLDRLLVLAAPSVLLSLPPGGSEPRPAPPPRGEALCPSPCLCLQWAAVLVALLPCRPRLFC